MEAQIESRGLQAVHTTALTELSDEALGTINGGNPFIDAYDAVRDFVDGFIEGYQSTQK